MEMKGVLGGNFPPRRVGRPQQRAGAGRDFSLPFLEKTGTDLDFCIDREN